jgi:hypothetical protein
MPENLEFMWIARFKDGKVLQQFNGKSETNYREVLQRMEDLIFFEVTNGVTSVGFNLLKGKFMINGYELDIPLQPTNSRKKFVYVRRVQHLNKMNGSLFYGPVVSYFIGYESTDELSKKFIEILPVENSAGLRLVLRDQKDTDSWVLKEDSERSVIVEFLPDLQYVDFKPVVVRA